MIVVSNRVSIPEERVEMFLNRLETDHGIEEQAGFRGLKVLSPVEADRFVTMTFWDSLDDYEAWRDGNTYERAHSGRSRDEVFASPNEVEIHKVAVNRSAKSEDSSQ